MFMSVRQKSIYNVGKSRSRMVLTIAAAILTRAVWTTATWNTPAVVLVVMAGVVLVVTVSPQMNDSLLALYWGRRMNRRWRHFSEYLYPP